VEARQGIKKKRKKSKTRKRGFSVLLWHTWGLEGRGFQLHGQEKGGRYREFPCIKGKIANGGK